MNNQIRKNQANYKSGPVTKMSLPVNKQGFVPQALAYISLVSQCNDISRQQRKLYSLLMLPCMLLMLTLNKYLKSLVFYCFSADECISFFKKEAK